MGDPRCELLHREKHICTRPKIKLLSSTVVLSISMLGDHPLAKAERDYSRSFPAQSHHCGQGRPS